MDIKIVLFGLDNAGKTSIQERLRRDEFRPTKATLSVNTVKIPYGDGKILKDTATIFDFAGHHQLRNVWKLLGSHSHGVLFVIDIVATHRFEEAKQALGMILEYHKKHPQPILLIFNKMDLVTNLEFFNHQEWLQLFEGFPVETYDYIYTSCKDGKGIPEMKKWIEKRITRVRFEDVE